jgi:thiol:disulfide interchange protein DsbD
VKTTISIFFILLSQLLFSQNKLNPVSWTVSYKDISNMEGELTFVAKIDPKWHIYSQKPVQDGPIPTSFTITVNNPNFDLIGKLEEGAAHEEYVAAFDAKLYVFESEAIFKQKIKRKTKAEFFITSAVEFMTCNDSQCLPPSTIELIVKTPAIVLKSKL